jgi:hypothetical protein
MLSLYILSILTIAFYALTPEPYDRAESELAVES